jgi:hypothetical protein
MRSCFFYTQAYDSEDNTTAIEPATDGNGDETHLQIFSIAVPPAEAGGVEDVGVGRVFRVSLIALPSANIRKSTSTSYRYPCLVNLGAKKMIDYSRRMRPRVAQ